MSSPFRDRLLAMARQASPNKPFVVRVSWDVAGGEKEAQDWCRRAVVTFASARAYIRKQSDKAQKRKGEPPLPVTDCEDVVCRSIRKVGYHELHFIIDSDTFFDDLFEIVGGGVMPSPSDMRRMIAGDAPTAKPNAPTSTGSTFDDLANLPLDADPFAEG